MKAQELMMGDWVMKTDLDGNPVAPYQIDWIRTGEVGLFWNVRTTPPLIIPIPLTAEILEKNGWLQNGMTQEAIMECDGENCDDTWVSSSPLDRMLSVYFDCGVPLLSYDGEIEFLKVSYVHELQHALRLCGLTELADNFKID